VCIGSREQRIGRSKIKLFDRKIDHEDADKSLTSRSGFKETKAFVPDLDPSGQRFQSTKAENCSVNFLVLPFCIAYSQKFSEPSLKTE